MRPVSDDLERAPGPAHEVQQSGRARRGTPLLLAGLMLLLLAWAGGQPPGAAPDEAAHLVKGIGLTNGQLRGDATTARPPRGDTFLAGYARAYEVPGSYEFPSSPPCYKASAARSARCLAVDPGGVRSPQDRSGAVLGKEPPGRAVSYVSPYPPAPYLLPGIFGRWGGDARTHFLLGRIGQVLSVLALLALALRRSTAMERLGLLLALTPMSLFLMGSVNPSGLSVAAALTLVAAGLRLARAPSRIDAVAVVLAGTVLSFSRPEGPLLTVAAAATVLGLAGVRRRMAVVGALLAAAVLGGLAWTLLLLPRLSGVAGGGDGGSLRSSVRDSVKGLFELTRELVGLFGWQDVVLPLPLPLLWLAALLLLLLLALAVGTWRERLVLLALCASVPAAVVVEQALLLDPIGATMQARYVLPLAVLVPVAAGWVLARSPMGDRALEAVAAAAVILAGVHVLALWVDGRRYATGTDGSLLTWPFTAQWTPLGGWAPWLACALAGGALVAWSFVRAWSDSRVTAR